MKEIGEIQTSFRTSGRSPFTSTGITPIPSPYITQLRNDQFTFQNERPKQRSKGTVERGYYSYSSSFKNVRQVEKRKSQKIFEERIKRIRTFEKKMQNVQDEEGTYLTYYS